MAEVQENRRARIWGELKKGSRIAGPMVAVTVSEYLLQVVSMIMVGHLGQLALSSAAIATSLCNVTGFTLHGGLVGGLDTLCGQAYGAKQYQKLGVYTTSAMISLLLICPPSCILWALMGKILPLIGQDPLISKGAGKYSLLLIPGLFGSAILKPLTRYLQTQSLIIPLLVSSFTILCLHIPICWIFVYKSELRYLGAALAFSISIWLNLIMLGVYVRCSSACKETRGSFLSKDAFFAIGEFFMLAIPSAAMACLKWWAMEVLAVLAGLLPNPKLQTSVLSICLTVSTLHFTVPYGLGVAASTRASNELGAGNSEAARLAAWVVVSVVAVEAIIVSATLFGCRKILGYAFSNDKQIVHFIDGITPFICLSIINDSFQAVFAGIARGCGWQRIGAYINLVAFYVVGLPLGALLGFVAHLKGKGLWIGIVAGSFVQASLLCMITFFTDWEKQAAKAMERTSKEISNIQRD